MINTISKFAKSEDGAVTVDWVVLTAAIVGFGVAVIAILGPAAVRKSDAVGTVMDNHSADAAF